MEKCCLKKTAGLVGGGVVAALFALLSFALFSCSNMSGGGASSSKNSYPVVRFVANMQSDLAAAPQEISGLVSASAGTESFFNDGISRSAMPNITIDSEADAGVKYYVEAVTGTKGTDSYIRHFVYGNSSTLELGLESGKTWSVTCGIGEIGPEDSEDPNSKKIVLTNYMSDNDPSVTISPDNPVYTKTFGLKPFVTEGGKGNLELYVSVPTGYVIRTDSDTLDFFKNNEFTPASSPALIQGSNLESGAHEVIFKVYDTNDVLVYCATQTINIFDNMTTNSWRDDGSDAFKTATVEEKSILVFTVDDALIKQFVDNTIYVGATGFGIEPDDNNAGTAFTPLNKLDAAFKRIAANGNRKDYRIYICGAVDQPNFVVNSDIISAKAASITIEGYNGLDSSGNPKDKILAQGGTSVFSTGLISVNSSVPITTKKIWLTKKDGESSQSRGLYLYSGANVTLGPGTVISGFDAGSYYGGDSGGGVYVASGATLTVKGAVIKDNRAYEGGGLCVAGDGSVTMSIDGSQITGNHALYGGGISVKGAKVKITKTSISGNKADLDVNHDSGGGLSLDGGADVTLGNGVVVQGNTARIGGGVNMAGGTLTLEGGQIIQNKAVIEGENAGSGCGGGIDFTYEDCNVYVYDGSISGNTANNLGGAIHFNGDGAEEDSSHSLYVTGGTIENNSAAKGGAIYIYPTNEGAYRHFTFTLGGSASIPYGVDGAQGEGKNDIYFDGPNSLSYASIALQSALSKHGKTNPVAIRIADAGAKRGVPVVKAASPLASLDACKDSFKLYSDDWNLKLSSDKKTLVLDAPIWVAGTSGKQQCTGTPSENGPGTKSAPYDSIYNACSAMTDLSVEYTILIDGTLTAKQFFKSCQAASISIEGANGLYPAGHEKAGQPMDAIDGSGIAPNQKDYMLYIGRAFDITIKNLKITGGDRSGNKNEGNVEGGGIFLNSGKTLTLSSGTLITKNKAGHGGGVYVQDSTLVIEDGAKITKNTATGGGIVANIGGGVYLKKNNGKPVLKMAGGEISGNIASKGGGVGLYGASFFMYGNAIIGADLPEGQVGSSDTDKGCNTANCGGGIYLEGSDVYLGYEDANENGSPKTPHKLEKGVIGNYSYGTSTTATTYGGGGIYWSYNSNGRARIYMASGQIAKNAAEQKGGAIYYYSGSNTTSTLTIGGDASIPALDGANDVCLLSPATLAGALTKHGASNPITITPDMYQSHGATVFKTDPERVLTSDDLKCFKLSAAKEDAGLALTLSSDCKSIKLDKPIYVKQGGTPSGSGTANGTKTKPYGSIQAACGAMTSSSLDYTILVDGIDPSTGDPMPLLGAQTIPEGVTAKSITIMGANGFYTSGDKAGEPKDALNGNNCSAPVLTAECSCPVVFGNIKITGAKNGANGGGVWREKGDLYIQEGTLITRNIANQGAGVFVSRCNLYMSGGQITSNESTISNGTYSGGICLTGNTSHNNGAFIYGKAVIGGVNKEHPACPTSTTTKDDVLNNGGNWCANQKGGGVGCFDANLYLGYKSANDDGSPNEEAPWTGGIYGNYAGGEGGGVYVRGKMYMNSGEIAYNYTKSNGGGIGLVASSSGIMSDGKIHHNSSVYGGGVYNAGSFTMTDGEISDNKATLGGGVYNAGDFGMEDGEIYGNSVTGSDGAGGGVANNGFFGMSGGKIYANDGGLLGGGVYQSSGSSEIALSGTAVIGDTSKPNVAKQGGGIGCKEDVASITRIGWYNGSERSSYTGGLMGNQATAGSGGAIYTNKSSKLHFYSGRISGNTASAGKGNGVYAHPEANAIEMKGYVRFDASDDIWLAPPESGNPKTIKITGALTPTDTGASGGTAADKTATITPGAYNPGDRVLTGTTDALVSGNYGKFALAQDASDPSQTWILDSDGCIYGSQPVLAIDRSNGMTSQDRDFITGAVVGSGTENDPYVLELGGLDTLKFQIKGGLGSKAVYSAESNSGMTAGVTLVKPTYSRFYNLTIPDAGLKKKMLIVINPNDPATRVEVPFWVLVKKPAYFMGTPYKANDDGTVLFGDWPQTIKASSVNLSSTIQVQQQQDGVAQYTYYLGDDGSWYCEQNERGCTDYGTIKYSDGETTVGTGGSTSKWFKVEPIEWKLLNSSSGTRLLHAKNILEAMHFDTSGNDYAGSVIRTYLNGSFLNSAFSPSLRDEIRDTTVNGVTDKVYLFQKSTADYTPYFADDNARIRFPTDFAKATGAAVPSYSTGGGMWWTRDFDEINNVYFVNSGGRTNDACSPSRSYVGLAPAMWVKLY